MGGSGFSDGLETSELHNQRRIEAIDITLQAAESEFLFRMIHFRNPLVSS